MHHSTSSLIFILLNSVCIYSCAKLLSFSTEFRSMKFETIHRFSSNCSMAFRVPALAWDRMKWVAMEWDRTGRTYRQQGDQKETDRLSWSTKNLMNLRRVDNTDVLYQKRHIGRALHPRVNHTYLHFGLSINFSVSISELSTQLPSLHRRCNFLWIYRVVAVPWCNNVWQATIAHSTVRDMDDFETEGHPVKTMIKYSLLTGLKFESQTAFTDQ